MVWSIHSCTFHSLSLQVIQRQQSSNFVLSVNVFYFSSHSSFECVSNIPVPLSLMRLIHTGPFVASSNGNPRNLCRHLQYIFHACVCTEALCDQLIFPRQRVCSLSAGPVWYLNTAARERKKKKNLHLSVWDLLCAREIWWRSQGNTSKLLSCGSAEQVAGRSVLCRRVGVCVFTGKLKYKGSSSLLPGLDNRAQCFSGSVG